MLRTAESVSPSHPDKIADRISDAILDEALRQDPFSRVAVETMGGHGIITVTGEMTTKAFVDVREVVRRIVGDKYGVQVNIVRQSPEISQGVDTGGAGDQGIMVGYACNANRDLIPTEVFLSRSLCKSIFTKYPNDGKTQITLDGNNIQTIVASFQNVERKELEEEVMSWYMKNIEDNFNGNLFCNSAGDWQIGGFEADTGLTGRKLVIDNYGPEHTIGGGSFSGKDATKVDRSGAYMARKVAVDYLKKYDAKEVVTKLAYSIGVAEPVMAIAMVDGKEVAIEGYDLTPRGIIGLLGLTLPIFEPTACWGHFGNSFPWDK